MKVRMVADRPGGPDWAAPGSEVDFPNDHAQFLILRGDAIAVEEPKKAPAAAKPPAQAPAKPKST
jgi:hypothetical protein